MQQISTTLPPPVSLIAVMYRPNSVRKLRKKSRGTLQTHPDLPSTVSRNFQFSVLEHIFEESRCIQRFQPKCSRLPELGRLRHRRCRPDIARFGSGSFVGSPEGRSGRVLTFPRPFLATFNFMFSGAFLRNLDAPRDFSQNVAECLNFADFGIADTDQISLDLGPEAS